MEKRWAVSHIDWFDHELTTIIVKAELWWQAAIQHEKIQLIGLPISSLEEAKQAAFDCDSMINVVEIEP